MGFYYDCMRLILGGIAAERCLALSALAALLPFTVIIIAYLPVEYSNKLFKVCKQFVTNGILQRLPTEEMQKSYSAFRRLDEVRRFGQAAFYHNSRTSVWPLRMHGEGLWIPHSSRGLTGGFPPVCLLFVHFLWQDRKWTRHEVRSYVLIRG